MWFLTGGGHSSARVRPFRDVKLSIPGFSIEGRTSLWCVAFSNIVSFTFLRFFKPSLTLCFHWPVVSTLNFDRRYHMLLCALKYFRLISFHPQYFDKYATGIIGADDRNLYGCLFCHGCVSYLLTTLGRQEFNFSATFYFLFLVSSQS